MLFQLKKKYKILWLLSLTILNCFVFWHNFVIDVLMLFVIERFSCFDFMCIVEVVQMVGY